MKEIAFIMESYIEIGLRLSQQIFAVCLLVMHQDQGRIKMISGLRGF